MMDPIRDESERLLLQNESEASLLHGILEEDGVPHIIRSYHDRAYDGLWQMQEGWGYVETSVRFVGGVRVLLEVLRKNRPPQIWARKKTNPNRKRIAAPGISTTLRIFKSRASLRAPCHRADGAPLHQDHKGTGCADGRAHPQRYRRHCQDAHRQHVKGQREKDHRHRPGTGNDPGRHGDSQEIPHRESALGAALGAGCVS